MNLPLDAAAYEAKLNELITASTHVKPATIAPVATADFSQSFAR